MSRTAIQREFSKMEEQSDQNFMRLKKGRQKVLQFGSRGTMHSMGGY